VAGVEEEERKKRRRGRSRVLSLTWIFSQSPSAADPRVMDLRAARVEPDHRSSACGRALDLVGVWSGPRSCRRSSFGSASATRPRRSRRSPPRRGERTRRSAAEATRRWRIHPTVSTHTGEGLGRRLELALSAAAREREGGEKE
jgi:hypothetical protein